jgi:DNA-binding ferritin-like protein (Dps family)
MRQPIETVPSDGRFVILEDDAAGRYAVARWSAKANDWIGEDGEPIAIAPTHWHPEDNDSGLLSPRGPASSRRRLFGGSPFAPSRRRPEAGNVTALRPAADAEQADAFDMPTVPAESSRAPRTRRRLVAFSLATVVVAALVATSSRTDVVAYLKQYAGQRDVVRTGAPDAPLTVQAVQAADNTAAELRQSLQGERARVQTLEQDLATARREIDTLTPLASKAGDDAAQLKQITESAEQLRQERERAEALVQSLAKARRELAIYTAMAGKAGDDTAQIKRAAESTTAELRQSLQQERNKAEALAQDLATARREIDKHTALAGKAGDDAAQIKRAAESATMELRQSLQQERERAEVLAQSLATAQREIDKHTALAGKASDDAAQIKRAAESTTVELRQSLQQERERAEVLARDLATARREIDTHTALANKAGDDAAQIKLAAETTTAELRKSLQGERDRAEVLAQDLATARREIDTHMALASKAGDDAVQIKRAAEATTAELRKSLQGERDRAEVLAQDLATARREIDTHTALASKAGDDAARIKRAAESTAAELRQSLQQERDRAEALVQDLARAGRTIDMFAALSGKADDDAAQVKQSPEGTTAELQQSLQQERDRAEALAQTLATARREVDRYAALASKASDDALQIKRTAESTTAELRESLEYERDRADALASKAGDDAAQTKRAAESAAAELRHALQQERDKAEALAQTVASARREIDMYAALAGKASDDAALVKAAESTTAELRQSLQQERARAEALARDLESTRRLAAQPSAPEPTTIAQVAQVVETAAFQQPAAEPQDGPEVARLLARASALLNTGNIGAARIVLEHATATGSARASFALAETYDPLVLSTWGTYGTRGDPTRARELYAKAHAGGVKNAQERLNALQQ